MIPDTSNCERFERKALRLMTLGQDLNGRLAGLLQMARFRGTSLTETELAEQAALRRQLQEVEESWARLHQQRAGSAIAASKVGATPVRRRRASAEEAAGDQHAAR
jgi:hypothetical protein